MSSTGTLTPLAFCQLLQADPGDERLQAVDELFVAFDSSMDCSFERSWIFDADDTLWEDNLYYEEIMLELADYLIAKGAPADRQSIRDVINEIELRVVKEHGFGPRGFAISMKTAFCELQDQGSFQSSSTANDCKRQVQDQRLYVQRWHVQGMLSLRASPFRRVYAELGGGFLLQLYHRKRAT
jgi:hypothetical protein